MCSTALSIVCHMTNGQSLGVGLYSRVEAARLLRTPLRTLSRWVDGYVCELRGGRKAYGPVIGRQENLDVLSFGDLVELMYVRGFRNAGVQLAELRDAGMRVRREWDTPFPLATKKFATDGKHLLVASGPSWREALSGQFKAFSTTLCGNSFTLAI